jgi:signal transduction histidine kinase/ligand-binding sensor domain-containing protein
MTRRTLLVAVLLLRLAYGTDGTRALELGDVLTGYTLASWREGDGVNLGRVAAITQDADGYLWLGTDAGLVRFDGLRFEVLSGDSATALPAAPVRSLLLDRRGHLWVGYAEDAGLYALTDRRGVARRVQPVAGTVTALAEDADGGIWVGHDAGLARVDELAWQPVEDPALTRVQTLHVDSRASLWVGMAGGLLTRAPGSGLLERIDGVEGSVRDLSRDDEGVVWVTNPTRGFARLGSPAGVSRRPSGIGNRVLHDSRGNLWVATIGQGLWRVRPGAPDLALERATVLTGLLSDGVFSLFEDREGNIWVGTQEGLNRLTPHRATPVTDLGVVRSVAVTPDGAAWAGSADGLIRVTGVTSQSPGARSVWPLADIRTLHADPTGTLWVATPEGLHRFVRGTIARVLVGQAAPRHVTAMTSDHRGRLWLADAELGVRFLRDLHLTHWPTRLPQGARIAVMLVDREERVWLALESGQVAVSRGPASLRVFGPDDGLPHTLVSALLQDGSGRIWVGGNRGLSRLDGERFVTIDVSNGLPRSDVVAIVEDGDGFLWLGIRNVGIIRLHPDEFGRAVADPAHRVRYEHYGTTGGIAGLPLSLDSQNAVRAPDGRLWFVTGRGLTVVEPRSIESDWVPAPTEVRIETATANERRFPATDGLALPADTARLRIDYTALSLTYPDRVRFRYWLEGFDATWVDVGTRRQAIFTNLPPGQYRFRVQARTNEGVWSESAQTWRFAIEPSIYQRRSFQAALGGLLIAAVWMAWRVRIRKVHREIALVFAERTRLSREIHDTLLQSLVGLALQLDVVARRLGSSSAERDQLTRLRRLVEEYIREARQSIWDLRSPALQRMDLVSALQMLCRRATEDGPAAVELNVIGQRRGCPPKVQTHILRIAQEAVANAVTHGAAKHIQLELTFLDRSLALRVTDNGCGFDPERLTFGDGHYGLTGMKERAEDIGGRFSVATTRGAGTRVETIIPLPAHA